MHAALLEFDKEETPIDVLAPGLWRMCADNMPAKVTSALGKGTLGRAAHLVTMLEFPLKMGAEAIEQARATLTVTVTVTLTLTLPSPQP